MDIPKQIAFTKDGYNKLLHEQNELRDERKEAVVQLQKAREMGDLSENGYYKAAKSKLSSIDHRLHRLAYLIRYGTILHVTTDGQAQIGTTVVVTDGHNERSFSLVGDHEANPSEGKISTKSPIGHALIGRKKGDAISINTPKGVQLFTIVKVT